MSQTQLRHTAPARPPPPHTSGTHAASSQAHEEITHISSFKDLQKVSDLAYKLVHTGLQADEKGDNSLAKESYTKGLELLDRALRVNCEHLSQCTADQIDQAKEIQQKMNKTRQQIVFRLQAFQTEQGNGHYTQALMEPTAPPSYEEALSEPPSMPPSYEDDELAALGESLMRREISNSNLANAEVLFGIDDGVQIFYISGQGFVSAPTYPTSLHIVRFKNESQTQGPNGEEAPLFLHVGDWVYPLIPGASPALHTNYGAYIFPDATASESGDAVGLMIPETLPLEDRQQFEDIIRSFTLFGEQTQATSPTSESRTNLQAEPVTEEEEEAEPADTAAKISKGILTAAEWIVWGLEKGAEKAGELIRKGSAKYKQRYGPAEHAHRIDSKVQQGLIYAREATDKTVKVTGYIVNKIGAMTVAVAKQVAPHVREQGMKIIPESWKSKNSQDKSSVDQVVEIAGAGLKGFGTVYMGLESAGKCLGRCLAAETVDVVTYRYGSEAGNLAENTMYTAGNVFMTAHNTSHLGMKAVAKRAAKETGKAVLEDMRKGKAQKQTSLKLAGSSVDIGQNGNTDKKKPSNGGQKQ